MDNNAAHNLLGLTLETGWKVVEKIEKKDNQTGAFFSVCYYVEKNGETCFLKALDIMKFNSIMPGQSMMDVMNEMTTVFKYERDLSNYCRDKNVDKVSFVKESGEEFVSGFTFSVVPYLIFDLAKGDIRKTLNFSSDLDYAWRFKSLHDISVGLKQLHKIEVSHQDLKPSNILVFNEESKIGDLGRSMCKSMDGPYNNQVFTGDWNYAPPELLYRFYERDWYKRVFATDCYLLGSLIVFYFSGISMTALLRKHIPNEFSWDFWKGDFYEIRPYLENAYTSSLIEFENNIRQEEYLSDLKTLVEYLCNPFPDKRGHPKNILSVGSNYNLERFVSKLDLLKRKAELKIKKK
ncbi:protein kinase domain-containing protein [Chryseobacterium carnipullorum]|uniref:protein kinase domain-containing protein n=1 Tax=Chryseobacterium carnipullorum TaxID=1124835 RepID=UPI00090FE920|nr:protein kinase [Chryseobacterium carnipullorum]SHM90513.1 Protein kinase domain-containing protein [Chryseobacterium carnipullorum]HBV15268.1 protein kinase [Chryseobacterium carnipullorum]